MIIKNSQQIQKDIEYNEEKRYKETVVLQMEIRQLQYFLEVAKQKNMTKAAEVLHISQPALSKMVKNLEEELGMTLIIRSNKSSEVTDAGRNCNGICQKNECLVRRNVYHII